MGGEPIGRDKIKLIWNSETLQQSKTGTLPDFFRKDKIMEMLKVAGDTVKRKVLLVEDDERVGEEMGKSVTLVSFPLITAIVGNLSPSSNNVRYGGDTYLLKTYFTPNSSNSFIDLKLA